MYFGHEAMGAHNIPVYAMPKMTEFLTTNGPWSQLVSYKNIKLMPLANETPVIIKGIEVTPVLVPHRDEFSETVGYYIKGQNKTALFIPDINKWQLWQRDLVEEVAKVDYALIDATFYADGEIPGRAMEDIPHPFVVESMALFKDAPPTEKAKIHFIHMNHTNALLNPDSLASEDVLAMGFNIARPGMRLAL
jgi:pyrroloquinoline quinone biosynthesis protein B